MVCATYLTVFILSFQSIGLALAAKCYSAGFVDDVTSCDKYKNEVVDASSLISQSTYDEDTGETIVTLGGSVDLGSEIIRGVKAKFKVYEQTEIGLEYVYAGECDLCESVENDSAPWSEVMARLNITSCPIIVGTYFAAEIQISLDCCKEVLNRQFVGEYLVQITFEIEDEQIMCYNVYAAIFEKEC